jgi:hypothetical protein
VDLFKPIAFAKREVEYYRTDDWEAAAATTTKIIPDSLCRAEVH